MTTQKTSGGPVGSSALFGVLEWISLQGGTFNAFNPGLITGKVRGLTYRYFITEGWIGLKLPGCSAGKALECVTVEDFRCALESMRRTFDAASPTSLDAARNLLLDL